MYTCDTDSEGFHRTYIQPLTNESLSGVESRTAHQIESSSTNCKRGEAGKYAQVSRKRRFSRYEGVARVQTNGAMACGHRKGGGKLVYDWIAARDKGSSPENGHKNNDGGFVATARRIDTDQFANKSGLLQPHYPWGQKQKISW